MTGDPFRNYDAWLERPYQQRADQEAAYEAFCEAEELDMDDPEAERRWEEHCEAIEDDAQAEIDRWEAKMDAKAAEMEERGEW